MARESCLVSEIPAGDGKIANLFLQCTLGEPILGVKVALMHLKVKNICTSMEELETVQSHFGCIGERNQKQIVKRRLCICLLVPPCVYKYLTAECCHLLARLLRPVGPKDM